MILGLIATVCWAYALLNAAGLARQYTGTSVRIPGDPVLQKTLIRAQEQTDSAELFCTAAWTRGLPEEVEGLLTGGTASVRVICVYGDMRQTEPMKLLSGSFPTEDDEQGCLLDVTTAWTLFHSTDPIHATLKIDDKVYIVRGIVESYEPMVLIRNDRASYENLEFSSQNPDGAKQFIETFLYRCGCTENSVIVQGGLIARVVWGAAWLPLWIAAAYAAIILSKRGREMRGRPARSVPYRVAGVAVAALLCFGLVSTAFWPQSWLPTKWSDFAFWGRLIEAWQTQAKACALMTQLPKEIKLFSIVRRCAAALMISILSGGWCAASVRSKRCRTNAEY